jgi:DNA-binding response OmpR family regulator
MSVAMKVLIVEDNPAVARLLNQVALEAGYAPQCVGDGNVALDHASVETFDLILLDVMLPGLDGIEACRRLRERKVLAPILMITARDTLEDKVDGLDAGADDYIVKPFQVAELLARMRALLRRRASGATMLRVADLELDPATRRAMRGGKQVALSATEYSLLEYLMRHAGTVLTRAQILDHVWQYDFGGQDNVLDVYISYLRQKIDKGREPKLIQTARGIGFRLGEE